MLLLALDTSTSAITAAVHDGHEVIAEASSVDARAHGELLAPRIAEVLAAAGAVPADLTDIVVGVGPGPFTGLRVAIVTGRVMALATGARLHGVCSLDALAFAAREALGAGELVVATDARRKEVYWARYAVRPAAVAAGSSADPVAALTAAAVCRPADLPAGTADLPVVGRGPLLYPEAFGPPVPGLLDVSAGALAGLAVRRLAIGADPTGVLGGTEPLYLRRPDAVPQATPTSVAT